MKSTFATLLISLLGVMSPVIPMMLLAIAAIIFDTYFGIWKTVKLYGWKKVRSRRLSDTITKSFLYVGGINMIFLTEHYILTGISDNYTSIDYILTKGFTLYCIVTEGKSINENYFEVTGKNIWKSIVEMVKRAKLESDKFKQEQK